MADSDEANAHLSAAPLGASKTQPLLAAPLAQAWTVAVRPLVMVFQPLMPESQLVTSALLAASTPLSETPAPRLFQVEFSSQAVSIR